MQRCQLTDPVVRADRARPASLVEVDDEMRTPHRDVDGFAELRGELFADRPACWVTSRRPGTALASRRMPKPRRYLPRSGLLDQFAVLERGKQPERRRLMHADIGRDLATPASPRWARISNTLTARSTDWTPPALTSRVAHDATIRPTVMGKRDAYHASSR